MKMFKVITSNDAVEFERRVNEAIDEGYVFLEGSQTLIVDKEPTQFQFVRHMLHVDYTNMLQVKNEKAKLDGTMEFMQMYKEQIIQKSMMLYEIENESWNRKRQKDNKEKS